MKIFTHLSNSLKPTGSGGRHLLLALGLCLSWNAQAVDWQSMGLMDLGVFYIDKDSITSPEASNKHIRQVWSMLDYREPQKNALGKTYRSSRSLIEIDCEANRTKTVSLSLHAGARLGGEILTSEGVIGPWQAIPPDTPLVHIKKAICP